MEHLCGDLKYTDAWRKYGVFYATTQDFEFHPCWFLAPLQTMLDFQSALVHTQMFHSYIEQRRAEDLRARGRRAHCQQFIAAWVAFRWRRWRRRLEEEEEAAAIAYGGGWALQEGDEEEEEEESEEDEDMMFVL